MLRFLSGVAGVSILVLTLSGCGGGNEIGTVPVTGTVTQGGSPVEGATVAFSPAGGSGRVAVAQTDASGAFTMSTPGAGEGVVPGSYQVKITKTVVVGALTPEESQAYEERGETPPQPVTKNALPEKYANTDTSGLEITVEPGGNEGVTFEL